MAPVLSTLWSPESVLGTILRDLAVKDTRSLRNALSKVPKRTKILIAIFTAISTLSGAAIAYDARKKELKGKKELHRVSSAVLLSDGWSREIYVPNNGKQSKVVIKPTKRVTFEAHKRLFLGKNASEKRTGINALFFKELSAIWSIIVPHIRSKTSGLLFVHALFLAMRTYLSLLVAKLDGQIVRDLIAANGKEFCKGLGYWLLLAVPASYTNAMIKFLQSKISIEFRTKLIRYIHDIYLDSKQGFYKVNNIDDGIEGADQYITADITRFCDAAASLYSNLGKPSIDFILFSYQLSRNLGPLALMGIFFNYSTTAWILKKIAPPFGRLAAAEARLEGEYRNGHTKLITNAEEIAFYDGTGLERSILRRTFRKLIQHVSMVLRIKVPYNMIEDIVLKYAWSGLGYLFASLPVFLPAWSGNVKQDTYVPSINMAKKDFHERNRMREFVTNKRLMLSLADAGGRMMYSIKDLAELAGYTQRVFQLLATLHRVHANAYEHDSNDNNSKNKPAMTLGDAQGTTQTGFNGVRLEHTPIVVPTTGSNGVPAEVLVKDLNIRINQGDHLLISGSNGVGKSAIARVIGGIWPIFRGLLSKPMNGDIAFLPQRPYLSTGTLRDQIIYPSSHAEMLEEERSDDELMEILKLVKLEYLPAREGGWETKKQWKDVFSGGEKQRVMFARILYKHPKFAVIDEGTSAVSSDVEGLLYETCKKFDITLITISHRPSLLRYHTAQLKLGLGENADEWVLEKTDTEEAKISIEHEIADLESKLSKVDEWKARREEVGKLLSNAGAGTNSNSNTNTNTDTNTEEQTA